MIPIIEDPLLLLCIISKNLKFKLTCLFIQLYAQIG